MKDKENMVINYIEALEEEQKAVDLDDCIRKQNEDRSGWIDKVWEHILQKKYILAKELFYKILIDEKGEVNRYWLNTDAAILDIMFRIYEKEMEQGGPYIFDQISSLNEMQYIYFELKFLLRRFEYDLPQTLKADIIDFTEKYHISCWALIEMVKTCITKKQKVLNELAICFLQNKKYGYVLPLLSQAYDIEPVNKETLYNLAYFLYMIEEKETALEFLAEINEDWEPAAKLMRAIKQDEKLSSYDDVNTMYRKEEKQIPKIAVPENKEKIAFIICVNNERYYQECCYYIENLRIPEGYEIELIPIREAASMASGYQKGMCCTDARFKIYMHQDAFCINRNLLYEAIHIFEQNDKIGMIGVAGCEHMSKSGVWWESDGQRYYNLIQDGIMFYGYDSSWENSMLYNHKEYQNVEVVDGVFMMTSKDVDWREDLFDNWHFYDISQSFEFLRKGYEVVVPKPSDLWILHCEKCGDELGNDYRKSRIDFLKDYQMDLIL